MTQFLPIRGTATQINNTPIVDGQVLFETSNSNGQNHIYVDIKTHSSVLPNNFITDSPYYVNYDSTFLTIHSTNDIIVEKWHTGSAYGALVKHKNQTNEIVLTPVFVSNDEDEVAFYQNDTAHTRWSYFTFNDTTWYISRGDSVSSESSFSPTDVLYETSLIVNTESVATEIPSWEAVGAEFLNFLYNGTRVPIGISDWEQVTDKPFETIGNNLTVVNNVLSADDQTWNQILNKPFSSIGSGLTVTNGVLSANVATPSWSTIDNKPFTDIGVGLTVDSNNRLNADIRNIELSTEGTSAQNTFRHQVLAINISGTSTSTEVNGTKYMQYQQTLDTTNNTVYTFSNADITNTSAVDVFTDIWGIDPISVNIETGICRVTFAPHDTANTSMTCRIYIK